MPVTINRPIITTTYPVIVKEMVKILKPLIDDFCIYRYFNGAESYIGQIINSIYSLKRSEPKLFKQALKYLGAKRLRLLKEILAASKLKSQDKQ